MNRSLFLSIGILIVLFLPILLLGEDSYILLHDNLDSEFIYLHLLKVSNNLFTLNDSGVLTQVFNGLSTKSIHSEFSFIRVLFYLFPSFWAYVINSLLIRIVGIVGMHLLISTYFKDVKMSRILTIIIPLSFGLLPVYSLYGLSVMGQPLLLWSFLNLRDHIKIYLSFLIILLFPFYAHFAMTAPFLLIALFIYGMGFVLAKRTISINYFFAIGLLFVAYLIANYISIANFIFGDFISHRKEWHLQEKNLTQIVSTFISTSIFGQYHSSKIFGLPVLLLGVYVFIKKRRDSIHIAILLLTIVTIGLFYSVYKNIAVSLEEQVHILTTFQFDRFTFLLPFLYYLLLLNCLYFVTKSNLTMILVTSTFCLANVFYNDEIKLNAAKLVLPKSKTENIVSFSEFYSHDVFQLVNQYIGFSQENYRVVSLGLHPSIAQYNGFYTLDSYQNNYPLDYKNQFREVIVEELNKNQDLKAYYEDWGSRCYVFSAELKETCYLDCEKEISKSVNHLNINTNKLKQMGCDYILSAVNILNADDLNLKFEQSFESNESRYRIHLYKL